MATKVYGCSDDLVEIDGDFTGEIGCYGTDEGDLNDLGVLIAFSDGTILSVRYGKLGFPGVWGIAVLRAGNLFERVEPCFDSEGRPYSDVVHFRDGDMKAWWGAHGRAVD